MTRLNITITPQTTLQELASFAAKAGGEDKIRGEKDRQGNITLYASPRRHGILTGVFNRSSRTEKQNLARQGITEVFKLNGKVNSPLISVFASIAKGEISGKSLQQVANKALDVDLPGRATKLIDQVAHPATPRTTTSIAQDLKSLESARQELSTIGDPKKLLPGVDTAIHQLRTIQLANLVRYGVNENGSNPSTLFRTDSAETKGIGKLLRPEFSELFGGKVAAFHGRLPAANTPQEKDFANPQSPRIAQSAQAFLNDLGISPSAKDRQSAIQALPQGFRQELRALYDVVKQSYPNDVNADKIARQVVVGTLFLRGITPGLTSVSSAKAFELVPQDSQLASSSSAASVVSKLIQSLANGASPTDDKIASSFATLTGNQSENYVDLIGTFIDELVSSVTVDQQLINEATQIANSEHSQKVASELKSTAQQALKKLESVKNWAQERTTDLYLNNGLTAMLMEQGYTGKGIDALSSIFKSINLDAAQSHHLTTNAGTLLENYQGSFPTELKPVADFYNKHQQDWSNAAENLRVARSNEMTKPQEIDELQKKVSQFNEPFQKLLQSAATAIEKTLPTVTEDQFRDWAKSKAK